MANRAGPLSTTPNRKCIRRAVYISTTFTARIGRRTLPAALFRPICSGRGRPLRFVVLAVEVEAFAHE